MDGWSNFFFALLGVPALSLSHGEVGGRCFWFGGNPLPDHGVPRWKGGDPEEEQPNRLHPLPAEDINPLKRVAHAANASTIRSVHTTDFTHMAPTTELVVLTSDSAAPPYVQLANELFSDFRSASAEEPVSMTGSRPYGRERAGSVLGSSPSPNQNDPSGFPGSISHSPERPSCTIKPFLERFPAH
jgi:hypothetical protein